MTIKSDNQTLKTKTPGNASIVSPTIESRVQKLSKEERDFNRKLVNLLLRQLIPIEKLKKHPLTSCIGC